MNYQKICARVCEIAREAGTYIAEQRATFSFDDVEYKGVQNMVSYVDRGSERLVVETSGRLVARGRVRDRRGNGTCHGQCPFEMDHRPVGRDDQLYSRLAALLCEPGLDGGE